MPKSTTSDARRERRHNPLSEEYLPSLPQKQRAIKRKKSQTEGGDADHYVDTKASRKILKIGQDLADEDEAEQQALRPQASNPAFAFESRFAEDVVSDDDEDEQPGGDGDEWGDADEEEEVEEVEVDPNDLAMFNRFNPEFDPADLLQPKSAETEEEQGTNLADLILEKIAAHEAAHAGQRDVVGGGPPEDAIELPAKVVEVYTQYVAKVAQLLPRSY